MSVAVAAPAFSAAPVASPPPLRVMIVDDAVVVRGLVSRWVEEEGFQVVASLRTGRDAVNQIERANPDVVVLDVEMPELDGISALPLLLEKKRDLVVIMASTVTRRNAEISLRALALGAADYVPKPENNRGVTTSLEFRRELIDKIRHLGLRRKSHATPSARGSAGTPVGSVRPAVERPGPGAGPIKLRPFSALLPRVLLIGSSTGGPQALNALVTRIGSPSTASCAGRSADRRRCSARIVVNIGGMCWVISTGTASMMVPIRVTIALSACGPPVEEPISKTRGNSAENGRSLIGPAPGPGRSTAGRTDPTGVPAGPRADGVA